MKLDKKKVTLNSAEVLYNTLVKLSKRHHDVKVFATQGIKAIKLYAHSENININFRSHTLKKVLEHDLKAIYRDLKKPQSAGYFQKFMVWLKELGSHLGFTKPHKLSTSFMKKNLQKIEKAQYEQIKQDHYALPDTQSKKSRS